MLDKDAIMLQLELENHANHGNLACQQKEQWTRAKLTNHNNQKNQNYKGFSI